MLWSRVALITVSYQSWLLDTLDASSHVATSRPFEELKDMNHFRLGNNVMSRCVKLNKKEYGEPNIAEVRVCGTHIALIALSSLSLQPIIE